MKASFRSTFYLAGAVLLGAGPIALQAATNVAPTPVVIQAVQRPGTTFMDIDYQVNDPDDATVEVAALAFVDGGTSLSDVIKLNTLVEGTAANLGSNITANTTHRLTWNVAADWNTNFGNVQIEILAKDGRGLLPFHWVTLASNGPNPEITINDRPIYDGDLLPVWYWLIAKGDPAVQLVSGKLRGQGGSYDSNLLAQGELTAVRGRDFLWERLAIRSLSEIARAKAGRYGFQSVDRFSVVKGAVGVSDVIFTWGNSPHGGLPKYTNVRGVAMGRDYSLLLTASGGIVGWGDDSSGQLTVPETAINAVAVAAGNGHNLALRGDGTVVGWGNNGNGQVNIPPSATGVTAIAAGQFHSLALKSNGTVVAWGNNDFGQTNVPPGLADVSSIAAGGYHSLALKSNGTLVAWGNNSHGQINTAGISNVTAISAGNLHSYVLKSDGTVYSWGYNAHGQTDVPAGLNNIAAISAGDSFSMALRSNGTVVVWGGYVDANNVSNVPLGVSSIDLLGVGCFARHAVAVDKQSP